MYVPITLEFKTAEGQRKEFKIKMQDSDYEQLVDVLSGIAYKDCSEPGDVFEVEGTLPE